MMEGDIAAHKCPKCGKQEWRVYQGGGRPQGQARAHVVVQRSWISEAIDYALLAAGVLMVAYLGMIFVRELRAK